MRVRRLRARADARATGRWWAAIGPLALLFAVATTGAAQNPAKPTPEAIRFFETRVRPVLANHCFACHGERAPQGGLSLMSRAGLLTGGKRGAALVPGSPEESLLIRAVRHEEAHLQMPPAKQLTRQQVADLTQWVQMGAPWPDSLFQKHKDAKTQHATRNTHWAFQPLKRVLPPKIQNPISRIQNPIDAFILAQLQAKGLQPNPPASKQVLIRRVYYDLTGLPPSPEEVQAFIQDKRPDAYERLIDRLLASPHYGEKWGRHWLDLVRFAETNSYERDNPKPNAWRYRDYVIRAFNADKPFDRFIREQLAGDELPDRDNDSLIATGYYRLGIWDDEPTDRELARYDGLDDIITTTGQVFLGLTLDCARCHDHKVDPISQKDYYRFLAFFQNINHFRNGGPTDETPLFRDAAEKREYERRVRERERQRAETQAALAAIENDFRAALGSAPAPQDDLAARIATDGARVLGRERFERYQRLRRERDELQRPIEWDRALIVTEAGGRAPETFVLLRGSPEAKGEQVEPGFPQVLEARAPRLPEPPADAPTTGRRRVLADWIASPQNPLTARVIVNRVWQHHFGRGLVRSSNNFGLQGDRPTHPELLDWLAATFMEKESVEVGEHGGKEARTPMRSLSYARYACGWSLKKLHRLIMTSRTYQMSSQPHQKALKADPANDLFWRFDMRRLTAEEIRDSILRVSGVLNLKMYGPGVYPEIPKAVLAGQSMPGYGWGKSTPEEQNRRSIYIHVKRSLIVPILASFDLAETDRTAPVRFSTTQPTQALSMLNSDFLHQQAARFAERLRREAGEETWAQVRRALWLVTSRAPTEEEVRRGVRLIEALQKDGASPETARKYFCLMALNLNEFLYLD